MRVKKQFSNSTVKSDMKIEGKNTRNAGEMKKALSSHNITVKAQMCHLKHQCVMVASSKLLGHSLADASIFSSSCRSD